MNKLAAKMKNVWENIKPRSAHLGISGEKEIMFARYKALITDKIKVNNKTIIDFGCGGGLLGLYLLQTYKPAEYIGYDLAERSLANAKINLINYENALLIELKEHRFNFALHNPDIIVCLACIIHFPTQLYLNNFLIECNQSKAKKLILEIRDAGSGTKFNKTPYANLDNVYKACFTEETYLSERLTNYNITDKSEISETGCQVLWYTLKKV